MSDILIVGASVAGVRTAQALRTSGCQASITMLSEETELPYDKPPLSKEMLAESSPGTAVPLLSSDEVSALEIDLHIATRAVRLDPDRRVVHTADGREFGYSTLVIATGVRPRTLPGTDGLAGVYTLRQAEDARELRAELPRAKQVVVIGAGFIGAEFASAAVKYGASVTIVEAQATPLAHILGEGVGRQLAGLHALNGVTVLAGEQVSGFLGTDRVTGVELASGRTLPADLVVIGIGTQTNSEWLADSGVPISNGVECDENLRVPGFPEIFAAGDIALRQHPIYQTPVRIEHWTNAGEHGGIVAAAIMGAPSPTSQPPYVWSDQYGRRIQIIGRPSLGHVAVTRGSADEPGFLAVYANAEGICVGAVILDDPRMMLRCRKAIVTGQKAADLDIPTLHREAFAK
ncbi:NAD(P)/FAD-dependent oxidoreductase [Smaragdicoccus niigatensis]|uniref:NAD(P)/FAD-dependent oxidoreductase n=1 Tax=Smaragdicoccus niigatensis TaxID=359359 RepID=UPI00037D773A|nr:FAD-dependent oxidoreductase [Smaragdicoccus niigatensis]